MLSIYLFLVPCSEQAVESLRPSISYVAKQVIPLLRDMEVDIKTAGSDEVDASVPTCCYPCKQRFTQVNAAKQAITWLLGDID